MRSTYGKITYVRDRKNDEPIATEYGRANCRHSQATFWINQITDRWPIGYRELSMSRMCRNSSCSRRKKKKNEEDILHKVKINTVVTEKQQ